MEKEFDYENNNFENADKDGFSESDAKNDGEEVYTIFDASQEEELAPEAMEGQADAGETETYSDARKYDVSEGSPDPYVAPPITVTHTVTKKRKAAFVKTVVLALICGVVFGTAFAVVNKLVKDHLMSNIKIGTTDVKLKKAEGAERPESDVSVIAQECMPSVVAITNHSVEDVVTFFGPYSQDITSSGSGIIIEQSDTELLIVTNYHVIANSKELRVVFSVVEKSLESKDGAVTIDDEAIPKAVVKGYDASKDLAVIAVPLDDIPKEILTKIKKAQIGDSSTLKPGDAVVAIGNSLGYGQSVTTGIVSAVDRNITMQSVDGRGTVTNSYIQTDAAINQGNSGGALLDMNGHVVGINSAKIVTTGVEGMGYAIPISDVENIINDLMSKQTRHTVDEDEQGFLGITGSDVTTEAAQMYGMPQGVFVNDVEKGLAAEKAGLEPGYIITEFEGDEITSMTQLKDRLTYYKAGEKVELTVKIPNGTSYTEKKLTLTLSKKPDDVE